MLGFPSSRRHKNCVFCQFLDDLPPPNPAYITSLRISWAPLLQDRQGGAGSCSTAVQHGVPLFAGAVRVGAVGNVRGRVGFAPVAVVSFSSFGSQNTSTCGAWVVAGPLVLLHASLPSQFAPSQRPTPPGLRLPAFPQGLKLWLRQWPRGKLRKVMPPVSRDGAPN